MGPPRLVEVLRNWLARSREGKLAPGLDAPEHVAERVAAWWSGEVGEDLGEAARLVAEVRTELLALGGWERRELHGALEAVTHLEESLEYLSQGLGLEESKE